jgi:teichuronic acid biosynthesis protein TuaE
VNIIVGIYEIFLGKYFFLGPDRVNLFLFYGYPVSYFYNPNNYSIFLFSGSIFLLYFFYLSKNFIYKVTLLILLCLSFFLIVQTKSRASLIAIVLSFFLIIIFRNKKQGLLIFKTTFFIISFIIFSVFIFTFMFDFNQSNEINSEIVRLNLVYNGLEFLISTFGFGVGSGNINYWMDNFGLINTGGLTDIHNYFFEILVSYGFIVFLLFISLYFYSIVSLFKKFYTDNNLAGFLSIFLIGFAISSLSASSMLTNYHSWIYISIVFAYSSISTKRILSNRFNYAN